MNKIMFSTLTDTGLGEVLCYNFIPEERKPMGVGSFGWLVATGPNNECLWSEKLLLESKWGTNCYLIVYVVIWQHKNHLG